MALFPIVQNAWDPLSARQTRLLTLFVQKLTEDYPSLTKESRNTRVLVQEIIERLKNAVDNDLFIPLYPKSLLEYPNSQALQFLNRQFWVAFKLLSNLMQWNWLLSRKKLQELGIDGILNRYLTIALQQMPDPVTALDHAKLIVGLLPKTWFESSETVISGLESFSRYLTALAGNVIKSALGYGEFEKKKAKITVTKIISLLMHLQAFDEARTIAREYKGDALNEPVKL